jgi:hypothetical protein
MEDCPIIRGRLRKTIGQSQTIERCLEVNGLLLDLERDIRRNGID